MPDSPYLLSVSRTCNTDNSVVWLTLTMLAVVTQTFIPLTNARPVEVQWHKSCIIQLCTIFALLLTLNMDAIPYAIASAIAQAILLSTNPNAQGLSATS